MSSEEERRRRLRHDLRTPLTIVSGFAEVLAAERAITDADRREYASRIQAAAVEIGELVDALLEEGSDPLAPLRGQTPRRGSSES